MQYSNTGSHPCMKFTYRYEWVYLTVLKRHPKWKSCISTAKGSQVWQRNQIQRFDDCTIQLNYTHSLTTAVEYTASSKCNRSFHKSSIRAIWPINNFYWKFLQNRQYACTMNYNNQPTMPSAWSILSCLRVWQLAKELLTFTTKAKAYIVWILPLHSYTTMETSTKS